MWSNKLIYYFLSLAFVALTFFIAHYTHFSEFIKGVCFTIHFLHFALGFSEGYTPQVLFILLLYYAIIIFLFAKFFELVIRLLRKDY